MGHGSIYCNPGHVKWIFIYLKGTKVVNEDPFGCGGSGKPKLFVCCGLTYILHDVIQCQSFFATHNALLGDYVTWMHICLA